MGEGWYIAIWRVLGALPVPEALIVMVWVRKGWKVMRVSLGGEVILTKPHFPFRLPALIESAVWILQIFAGVN